MTPAAAVEPEAEEENEELEAGAKPKEATLPPENEGLAPDPAAPKAAKPGRAAEEPLEPGAGSREANSDGEARAASEAREDLPPYWG